MSTKNDKIIKEAIEDAQSFFERAKQVNLIFVLCDVLGISRDTIADRLGVSRGQINHYREGRTNIPGDRIAIAISLAQEVIESLEHELKTLKNSAESKDRLQQAAIQSMQSRINLTSETLYEYALSQKKALDESYKSLEKIMTRSKKK